MTEISQALYRKYRPLQFDDVRNQDHIVSVLKGAIQKKNIPHALLFTGPRGTGKTTVARIFAHEVGADDVDIYEIDAASNRGIDDIRALRDSVHTLPYKSAYKIYIIDEVHMLTKEAFNALLKTLEEPPTHVVFILATTEKDKLLDTITSRCQVFTFKAPTREALRELVIDIAKREKCQIHKDAADVIALAADGSYRDALGITQKVMLASGDAKLTAEEVAVIVGAPKGVVLHDLFAACVEKDLARGLDALRIAAQDGVDVRLLYTLLLERLRAVLLVRYNPKHMDTLQALYTPDEVMMIETAARTPESTINSHTLVKALRVGEYIGKSVVDMLPLEVFLIEHCTTP